MKLLVTGGSGFIGHNVVKLLTQQGHDVLVADNHTDYGFIPRDELSYLYAERNKKHSAKCLDIDIRNQIFLHDAINAFAPDVIIHCASFPRQKIVNLNPVAGSDVMMTALVNLLELSVKHRVKRFVYVSSSMVYGDFITGTDETQVCNPQGQYGILKYAGELLVKDYQRRTGIETVILRPSAVYGELDVEDRVISKFLLGAMRDETLKIKGAYEVLDFTHVDDAAMGITLAALSPHTSGKTYNITRNDIITHTLLSTAITVIHMVKKGSYCVMDKDENFPSRGNLSNWAAKRDFGFNPKINLQEGLARYYAWIRESEFWAQKL